MSDVFDIWLALISAKGINRVFSLFLALAASLTCASVALANAGIEMYDLVVGCSAVSQNTSNSVYLNTSIFRHKESYMYVRIFTVKISLFFYNI